MKRQLLKKLPAFIFLTMMFITIAESSDAQKKCDGGQQCPKGKYCVNGVCTTVTSYFCQCGVRGYGCGEQGAACVQYCVGVCGGWFANKTVANELEGTVSGISFNQQTSTINSIKTTPVQSTMVTRDYEIIPEQITAAPAKEVMENPQTKNPEQPQVTIAKKKSKKRQVHTRVNLISK